MQLGGKEPLKNRHMPHQLSDTVEAKLLVFVTMYIPKYIAKTTKEFLIAKQSSLAKSSHLFSAQEHMNIKPKAKILTEQPDWTSKHLCPWSLDLRKSSAAKDFYPSIGNGPYIFKIVVNF